MNGATQPAEFLTAMRSVKTAKNVFLVLVLLAILVQLAAVIAVRWGGVIDNASAVQTATETPPPPTANEPRDEMAAEPPADAEAAAQPAEDTAPPAKDTKHESEPGGNEAAELWYVTLTWLLPGSKFVLVVATSILVVILMFATLLAINARASGVAGIVSAALWSLLLLAIITPWQQVLNTTVACGATFNFGELIARSQAIIQRWGASGPSLLEQILYYARFLAYPALALLVWLVILLKFARGYGRMLRVALGEEDETPAPSDE